jgi:hypothetical protein
LQHGSFAAGFFFAGAECIGHPLASTPEFAGSVIAPSAQ